MLLYLDEGIGDFDKKKRTKIFRYHIYRFFIKTVTITLTNDLWLHL